MEFFLNIENDQVMKTKEKLCQKRLFRNLLVKERENTFITQLVGETTFFCSNVPPALQYCNIGVGEEGTVEPGSNFFSHFRIVDWSLIDLWKFQFVWGNLMYAVYVYLLQYIYIIEWTGVQYLVHSKNKEQEVTIDREDIVITRNLVQTRLYSDLANNPPPTNHPSPNIISQIFSCKSWTTNRTLYWSKGIRHQTI